MRIIKLEKYDQSGTSLHAQAWQIFWLSVVNYPAGNREQTAVGNAVYNMLREVSDPVTSTDAKGREVETGQRRLKAAGAELYFEDSEFRLLGQAVDKFRDSINLSGSDALLWIDKMLEKAPEVSKKDYIAKVKKIKLDPSKTE